MEPINELMQVRLEKRAKLIEQGIDPYGSRFEPSDTAASARATPTPERDVQLAGRLISHRDMGKSMFADIKDSTSATRSSSGSNIWWTSATSSGWPASCSRRMPGS
jgi:lysyl-tRNA synthetase class II